MGGVAFRYGGSSAVLALSLIVMGGCGARSTLARGDDAGVDEGLDLGLRADVGVDQGEPPCLAEERCNGIDDDCDGRVDEDLSLVPSGPLQTLREDEADTGSLPRCSSCAWAFNSQLVPFADGVLHLFTIGIWGSAPQPSLYGRVLEPDGTPRGPVRLLDDDAVVLDLSPMCVPMPFPGRGTALQASFRVGSDNRPGFVVVEPETGTVQTSLVRIPEAQNRRTVALPGDDVDFVLFAAPPVTFIDEVEVYVVTVDGRVLRTPPALTLPNLRGELRVARREAPGGVVIGVLLSSFNLETREAGRTLVRLDGQGRELGRRAIPTALEQTVGFVGTAEGWLLLQNERTFEGPAERLTLSPEGEVLAGPASLFDARFAGNLLRAGDGTGGRLVSFAAQRSPVVGLPTEVALWSSLGVPVAETTLEIPVDERYPDDETAFFQGPALLYQADGEDLLLAWHLLSPDGRPNRIHLQRFSCAPR